MGLQASRIQNSLTYTFFLVLHFLDFGDVLFEDFTSFL